ncbi:uncharacterized protein LOC120491833 isoform X2 [Pimephales promelas]|uniref:uncharacterized protein LOC120491833 isoform X2 n=1 Tax=Pimephales promelas TaxID=90988 RepID=UPI001955CBB4|nr:uncharacterized protein LOC120491833 isoform X2 [Pimephales promelas]KAG1941981.1 hypothetical protein F2P79_015714 [Pimephales promelas]
MEPSLRFPPAASLWKIAGRWCGAVEGLRRASVAALRALLAGERREWTLVDHESGRWRRARRGRAFARRLASEDPPATVDLSLKLRNSYFFYSSMAVIIGLCGHLYECSISRGLENGMALPSGEERELIDHTCRLLHGRRYLLKRSSREHSNGTNGHIISEHWLLKTGDSAI